MESMRAAYDDVAAAYQETVDPDGEGLRDPVFEELLGEVQGLRVLTLACGQGRDARLLADLGAEVVGVDISASLLAYARQFEHTSPRGIRYLRADAQGLPAVASNSFDRVVCHLALMDVPDLSATIAGAARVLQPGGSFVAAIVHPCWRRHLEVIDDYLADSRYDKVGGPDWLPPHAYHRPVSTYVNRLADAGLAITRMIEPREPDTTGVPGLLYLSCVLTT